MQCLVACFYCSGVIGNLCQKYSTSNMFLVKKTYCSESLLKNFIYFSSAQLVNFEVKVVTRLKNYIILVEI